MILVDYVYYTEEFRAGMPNPPISSEKEFKFYSNRAWDIINWKNLEFDDEFFETATNKLKDVVCIIAENLHFFQQAKSGVDSEGEAIVKSFNNRGYSETLAVPYEQLISITQDEFEKTLLRIVKKRLFNSTYHNLFVKAIGVNI